MKNKFALLLPLALLAVGSWVAPASANPDTERPNVGPAILSQRSDDAFSRSASANRAEPSGNYIGVAGSEEGAVVNGRYALSNRLSLRPEVFTNLADGEDDNGVAIYAPITYDFNGRDGDRAFQPFVGLGVGIETDGSTDFQMVTTAGVDYQLGDRYTLNGSVNYLPFEDQRTDFVAGVGYRF